jgi:hypothetical protein
MYGKKKPSFNSQKQAAVVKKEEEVVVEAAAVVAAVEKEEVADSWDAESDDDNWETNLDSGKVSTFVEERVVSINEDVEDTLVLENRVKFEQLRLLGIERAKRDEETRLRRYEMFHFLDVYLLVYNVYIRLLV